MTSACRQVNLRYSKINRQTRSSRRSALFQITSTFSSRDSSSCESLMRTYKQSFERFTRVLVNSRGVYLAGSLSMRLIINDVYKCALGYRSTTSVGDGVQLDDANSLTLGHDDGCHPRLRECLVLELNEMHTLYEETSAVRFRFLYPQRDTEIRGEQSL